jgi:acetyl-CoA C-acetyltransferase
VLLDPISGLVMGETGDNVAERFGVTREDQDQWALVSQQRAARAIKEGRFKGQIVPVELPGKKGAPIIFDTDEHPRPDTTLDGLARLKPIFRKDGTVTAGNACGMNDAAGCVLLMSEAKAKALGLKPSARIISYASVGVEPAIMGIGPIPATRKALSRAGMTIDQMDVIEFNEAFASQTLYCMRELKMDPEKVNPNGGAIALGHPIAATGAVLMTKLLHEMRSRRLRYGLVTMCMGGGLGIAAIVEGIYS